MKRDMLVVALGPTTDPLAGNQNLVLKTHRYKQSDLESLALKGEFCCLVTSTQRPGLGLKEVGIGSGRHRRMTRSNTSYWHADEAGMSKKA